MPKYKVTAAMPVYVSVTVEAENETDAEDIAMQEMSLTSFAGNGGSDKLVGVYETHVSIEPGEDIIEGCGYTVEVEEA